MSKALGMRCVWSLCGVLVSALAFASVTRAEVSTDVSGSVLVFPKVVYDIGGLGRDTIIQVTNTSNNMVHAHCFYVNGAPDFFGNPLWQVTDFTIWLTRQQPTHWVVSAGRPVNPADMFGTGGAGIDPGAIPPVPPGFDGELKCVQIDASGTPFGGNNLKGETVIRASSGDVSKHNAIAILANPDLAGDAPANELLLDNTPEHDGEYNSCPNQLYLNHFVDGTPDPVVEEFNSANCTDGDCPIRTYLTLVPCSEDFENQLPGEVTVQFAIVNELEQVFSASTTVECYETTRLADIDAPTGTCTVSGDPCVSDAQCIQGAAGFCSKNSVFAVGTLGTGSAFTRISPVALDGGVIGVAEEYHYLETGTVSRAAWNLQQAGNRYDATVNLPGGPVVDTITIPENF
ncbi:MAG: hypothetical protein SF182_16765 [Deltaproteobacteria bacterium]|nr:hypothetical protein [Deltaproteobacteria bacterium]